MKVFQLTYLLAVILFGCGKNYNQSAKLFDDSFSIILPEGMKECKGYDSIPDYLTMLYNVKTKKSHIFEGDSSYFSAMIVDTPCKNEFPDLLKHLDGFSNVFFEAYPKTSFTKSGNGSNDSFNYSYKSVKIEFSFATFSVFYSVSSFEGSLLYINYLEQNEDIEMVIKRGVEIMNSVKLL